MKPTRVAEVVEQLFDTRWPVFVWGPPGAGKSSVIRQAAARRAIPLIDIRAALLDPTDLRGIPTVVSGRSVWCPPSFLPADGDPPGLLFFDELSAAPTLVQGSLYQLTLDRRIGEYRLPDGWRIIAAGNRSHDSSIAFRMPAALANRFVHVDFEIDPGDWRQWAVGAGVHPLVVGFLALRPALLFDMSNPERGFPTPRSWEIVSDAVRAMGGVGPAADVILGIVGEGASVEFLSYAEEAMSEKAVRALIADPSGSPLPASLGDLYALVSYLASWAKERDVLAAAGVLLSRLSPELAVLLARDVLRVNSRFALDAGYKAFVSRHRELLA
jgi:hypothetical protein